MKIRSFFGFVREKTADFGIVLVGQAKLSSSEHRRSLFLNRKSRPFYSIGIILTQYNAIYKLLYDLRFAKNSPTAVYNIPLMNKYVLTIGI